MDVAGTRLQGLAGLRPGGARAPAEGAGGARRGAAADGFAPGGPAGAGQADFASVLAERLAAPGGLRLSRHAEERLRASGRALAAGELAEVAEAVSRAAARGAREALVVLADMALVVNVPSRTVVTAVEAGRMREHVFTQIDSAVLLQWRTPAGAGAPGGGVVSPGGPRGLAG